MAELVDKLASPSRLGSGRCHFAQDGGQPLRYSPVLWFNARSSHHSNCSTVGMLCLSSLRYGVSFM